MTTMEKFMKKKYLYLPDLPEDIMTDILLRLPILSILALKRISKQWYNLIKDPNFHNLYIKTPNPNPTALYFTIHSKIHCAHLPLHSARPILKNSPYYHELLSVPTTNNLICAKSTNKDLFIHNLLTGDSYAVPLPGSVVWSFYGFGYDSITGDYKITVACLRRCLVYTVRTRVWESFEGIPWEMRRSVQVLAYWFNGALHAARCRRSIVTFDLHTCRFGEMEGPPGVVETHDVTIRDCNVTELEGRLCWIQIEEWSKVNESPSSYSIVEVWVMGEYGVVDSWTKLFRFEKGLLRFADMCRLAYTWMYERGDGSKVVLFVFHTGDVFWYDVEKNKMEMSFWASRSESQGYSLLGFR